jgi:hypothetical protein
VDRSLAVACQENHEDETGEQDSFFEVFGAAVEAVEVGVTRIGAGDAVDGSASGDAVLLHVGDDPVLGEGGEAEHDEGDENAHHHAGAEDARANADDEEEHDEASGEEAFMMEDRETLGDDGAGGVGIGDGAECGPGGDGEEEESAEPDDESEPDEGAEQGFHAKQGTGFRVQGAASLERGAIGEQQVSKSANWKV